MKEIIFFLLSIIMFLSTEMALGQENNLSSANPGDAFLVSQLKYPVSHRTGVPEISIPLFEAEEGGIKIPLTLTYHAGGIKVNQQSTWVGLGWNLQVEPLITRKINGKDDIGSLGYIGYSGTTSYEDFSGTLSDWRGFADGVSDGEPDLFSYSLLNDRGNFMFQKYSSTSYEPLTIPYKPLKIEYGNKTFEITDDYGRHYLFDLKELTDPNTHGSEPSYITTWRCTRVVSANTKDTIYFSYNPYRVTDSYSFYDNVEILDSIMTSDYSMRATITNNSIVGSGSGNIGSTTTALEVPNYSGIYMKDLIYQVLPIPVFRLIGAQESYPVRHQSTRNSVLNEVRFNEGRILLYSVPNGYVGNRLDSIKVLNNDNYIIKTIKFYSRYINSQSQSAASNLERDYRFFLDSVVIDSPGSSRERYSFNYNEPSNYGANKPWSNKSDYWGYYNHNSGLLSNVAVPPISGVKVLDYNAPSSIQSYVTQIGGMPQSPYETAMMLNVLKSIVYPTGGRTEFEYSANKYMDGTNVKIAGGLRIERISSFLNTTDTVPVTEKIYKYGIGDLKIKPENLIFSYEQLLNGVGAGKYFYMRKRAFVSSTLNNIFYSTGCPVSYRSVTEYNGDMGALTGKTVYNYNPELSDASVKYKTNIIEDPIPIDGGELTSVFNYACKNGLYYLIEKKDYEYSKYERPEHILVGKSFRKVVYASDYTRTHEESLADFATVSYPQPVGCMLLTKVTTQTKGIGQLINTNSEVNYYYDNSSHLLLTRKETNDSKGNVVKKTIKYPSDINNGVYATMASLNMLNYPIEKTDYFNGSITESNLTTYKNDDGHYLPDKLYQLETTSPIASSSFVYFNGTTKDTNYGVSPEVTYVDYNSDGRLTKTQGKNGKYTYYLWAYNNQYPVAKIVSSINTTISISVNDNNLSKSDFLTNIQNDVAYLKTVLSSYINNSNYQVVLYTYKPLVGITSQTDISGISTFYSYDDLGRLKLVRDDDGNCIEKHEYNYAQ